MKTDLVDLKNPKPKKDDPSHMEPTVAGTYYEKYPYGLRVNLNEDQIKKLGLDISALKADSEIGIVGKGTVTRVSSEESVSGGKQRSLEIQIKELALSNEDDFAEGFRAAK